MSFKSKTIQHSIGKALIKLLKGQRLLDKNCLRALIVYKSLTIFLKKKNRVVQQSGLTISP